MIPSVDQTLKKHNYLKSFQENRNAPPEERRREVYMDESYIHEHYHRNDDSLWDPNDDQDVQHKKAPAKGRRYCFAAAIQGPSWKSIGTSGGLVPGSLWKFCPQKKGGHQGDYHKVFDSKNFLTWWKDQLLPNLTEPCVIMLDNASYHCCRHPDTPNASRMKKQECIDFLATKCPTFVVTGLSVLQLKAEVRKYIETNVPLEIVRLAEEKGHKVLFTPPYHSDLQPIELVWALVKGNIGRQYAIGTTLEIVNQRLETEFKKLQMTGQASIERMIESCAKTAARMHDEALDDDGNYESDESDHDEEEEEENSKNSTDHDEESDDDDSGRISGSEEFDVEHVEV